jgi:hypothetical protein
VGSRDGIIPEKMALAFALDSQLGVGSDSSPGLVVGTGRDNRASNGEFGADGYGHAQKGPLELLKHHCAGI